MFEELGEYAISSIVTEELLSFTKWFWKTLVRVHPKKSEKTALNPTLFLRLGFLEGAGLRTAEHWLGEHNRSLEFILIISKVKQQKRS